MSAGSGCRFRATVENWRHGQRPQRCGQPQQAQGPVVALPDERKYPIPDIEHARNALARVAQNGTAEEKKKVRAAVEKRYPSLKKDD